MNQGGGNGFAGKDAGVVAAVAAEEMDCTVNEGSPVMRNCMLCGKETSGSVGAAGIHWTTICQACKDAEDAAYRKKVVYQAKAMDIILEAMMGGAR